MHECASPASPIVCWFWCSHFSLAARATNGAASSEELDLHSFTTTTGHLSETFPGPFQLPSGLRCALYICLKAAMIVMFAISRLCDDVRQVDGDDSQGVRNGHENHGRRSSRGIRPGYAGNAAETWARELDRHRLEPVAGVLMRAERPCSPALRPRKLANSAETR